MTQNIKNFIEEGELELVQKINELEPSGFNIDSPYSDNGYYLDEDKTKEWYRSRQISLIKMIVEGLENYDLSVMGEDYKAGFKKCIELLK